MKQVIFYCSAVCLLQHNYAVAQTLSKNPTIQQVVSYRQYEQQNWNSQQLPKNSVVFKYQKKNAGWHSWEFDLKKEKNPEANLFAARYSPLLTNELPELSSNQQSKVLQPHLMLPKHSYNQWLKALLDGQGSLWLRDFILQTKSKNSFHL